MGAGPARVPKAERTRRQILAAAEHRFAAAGFEKTRLDDVAEDVFLRLFRNTVPLQRQKTPMPAPEEPDHRPRITEPAMFPRVAEQPPLHLRVQQEQRCAPAAAPAAVCS